MRCTLLAILFGALALGFTACKSGSSPSSASPEQKPVTAETPTPPSPWRVSRSWNEVTGEETITAITGWGEQTLVIRQIGKKLECYLTTGQFLETVDNMHSNLSVVKYKFDDGPIVRQAWHMSSDYDALFYPGDPSAFLKKMRKAKQFAIEYAPADVVPQTVSLDISQFPAGFNLKEAK